MLYVSIIVELLRARPALAMWLAAVAQALLWTFVPVLFYAGPPGDVPLVLAVGHEFQLGTYLGPPLAFWLAEIAFRVGGGTLFGVYALSQICVVVTYWAVFALGRSIVGAQQAVLAVLLMVGVSTFTVPTPEFGPVTLTMPLWAIILLHYWRAVGEMRPRYWLALGVDFGLLLLTTYAGLLLIALLVLFTLWNGRARATLRSREPWLAIVIALLVTSPHLLWLRSASEMLPTLNVVHGSVVDSFGTWLKLMAFVLAAHAGLVVMVALVAGWPWARQERAPIIVRPPVAPFARQFVYFFAIAPALAGTLAGVLIGAPGPVGGVAPLVILSGLAVIVAAGDTIELAHQHVVISAWVGLLLVPPLMAIFAVLALPWIGVELAVNRPIGAMAQFFAESFQRRIGTAVPIVAGEPRTAALVALASPSRPSLFLDANPKSSPWVTMSDIAGKGAIVVWPTADTAGTPPAGIREQFPDLVPEVPRAFERPIQGQLGLLRIGWAVLRPKSTEPEPQPQPPEGEAKSP